jgi:hypothetical protein
MLHARLLIAVIAVALAVMSVGSVAAGSANPYVVTRDDDPPPNGCNPSDCSLREAIIDSNATSPADTIIIPALHITLSIEGTDDTAQKGDLDITDDVTITGDGPGKSTISAANIDRVIDIPSPQNTDQSEAQVTISGVSISSGIHSGIHSAGFLTLDNVEVLGNTNGDGNGGGIESDFGNLLIDHSTIWKNSVTGGGKGGGIAAHRATTIRNSAIFANSAANGGGGIWATGGLGLFNSTVTTNSAGSGLGGGGVFIETAPGNFINSTIAENNSGNPGGGVYNKDAAITMTNTIVSNNTGGAKPDCAGTFSGDNNLVLDPAGCTLSGSDNITGADPMLSDLANHGGFTQTRAIPKDSPARDAGAADCEATDQRGIPRPQANGCDIGAYEYIFLGDVDCSGAVALADVTAYMRWLSTGKQPGCFYRGDIQCNLDFGVTDVLYLLYAYTQLDFPVERPAWCGDVGPYEP